MAPLRYSVLLVGAPGNRAWLRTLLPEGAIVAETDTDQATARLGAVTFDLVLCDSPIPDEMISVEQRLFWNREYRTVPRFYFVECGMPAPQVNRHVFVLEKPVKEQLIQGCLARMLERLETGLPPEAPAAVSVG